MNPSSSIPNSEMKDTRYPSYKHSSYHYSSRDREKSDRYYKSHHPYDISSDYHHPSNYYEAPYDKKPLYCYILLPKNYYNYITKNFSSLQSELRNEIKDISDIQYDYTLPNFQDYIFKLATYKISSKATAIRIISDYLFKEMKSTYKTMTYLKVSILIPDNVIGFIIGIDGKNINSIREETDAKIEVFPQNESKKYRKIEISGNPHSISEASERIYSITYKYINFGKDGRYPPEKDRRHKYSKSPSRSPSDSYRHRRDRSREEGMIRDQSDDRGKYYRERDRHAKIEYNNKPSYRDRYTRDITHDRERERRPIRRDSSRNHEHYSRYETITNVSNTNHYITSNTDIDIPPKNDLQNKTEIEKNEIKNEQNASNDIIHEISSQNNQDPQNQIPDLPQNPSPSSDIDKSEFAMKLKSTSSSDSSVRNLDLILSFEAIDTLSRYKNNIWIELENTYHCSVSKKVEKVNDKEVSVITFSGTPEENSLAIYHLQKILLSSSEQSTK